MAMNSNSTALRAATVTIAATLAETLAASGESGPVA
jgi:hypothetical protein